MVSTSLSKLFWAHRGLLSVKWEQYLPIYESELRPRLERGKPISLLEIGVQNGGSLEFWHKLLPPGSLVVGLDVDKRCRELKLSEGIQLHIGDATRQDFVNDALGEACFDIIIDDGSHRAADVIATFGVLFGRLNPGGTYIVEDMRASYWAAFGGGFRTAGSPIEWAKDLIDALNTDHFEDTLKLGQDELARLQAFNTQIARLAFFDSLLVVQKYATPKSRPFCRLLTGAEFPILDPMDWVPRWPVEKLANVLVNPSVARRLDTGMNQLLIEKNAAIKRMRQVIKRQEQANRDLLMSTSWKVTAPLRQVANLLRSVQRRLWKSLRTS